MAPYVSFCEFSMQNGALLAHLGSGLANDIIDRQLTDPSIRLCLQEPCGEQIHFRARCGVAEMTPVGPTPLPHNNEAEARGAWIRLLPITSRVLETICDALQKRPHTECLETAVKTGWIEIERGSMKEADLESARNILANTKLSNPEDKMFVRFGGTPDQIRQALSLLHKETSI